MTSLTVRIAFFALMVSQCFSLTAQEKSVRPGINDTFKNPDLKKYEGTFEGESREVFAKRKEIVAAMKLQPGSTVADIGAGTGLFTRLFAAEVGEKGRVFAVDIAEKFLQHVQKTSLDQGFKNVTTILCKPDSTELPPNSVDVAFICDTYHHFEFPTRTMSSLLKALKPGGKVVLIDFRRVKGQSSEWTMNHVRAGQEVFEQEIRDVGFTKLDEKTGILKENYMVVFEKPAPKLLYPVIEGFGGVQAIPGAVDGPTKGSKLVLDVTATAKDLSKAAPGLERAAVFLNLAKTAGVNPNEVELAVVLHGDATLAALTDETHLQQTGKSSPHGVLVDRLTKAGVKVYVCGQSLVRKGIDPKTIRPSVTIAASAISAITNHQAKGFSYIPAQN
jgi:intracellular sulfur oxidation DsrE/DsrF family protein/precorrin-6B methylase 2